MVKYHRLRRQNAFRADVINNIWAVFFTSVMVIVFSLAEKTVILMSYITVTWEDYGLLKATIIVTTQEGLTGVLVIVVAHIADAYAGRFKMVLLSILAYAIGLVVLWLQYQPKAAILYVAVVLIAYGKAGYEPLAASFFCDQFKYIDGSLETRWWRHVVYFLSVDTKSDLWWRIFCVVGAVLAIGISSELNWTPILLTVAISMGVAFVLFSLGFHFYYHEELTQSPLTTVYWVLTSAASKRHLPYSNDPCDYYENHKGQLPPNSLFFRWLYRAAIIESSITSSHSRLEELNEKGKLCTVKQVEEVKDLLRTIPMWTTFFFYCLVMTTGSTFFFEQTTNLRDPIVGSFLLFIQSLSKYTTSPLYDWIVKKCWPNVVRTRITQVKIGIGMLCSCFCCIVARLVEKRRLKLVIEYGFLDDTDKVVPMSGAWLIPQFFMLGVMEGLSGNGFASFFYEQVGESMRRYGPVFSDCVLGIGKFFTIFWLLTFRSWFGNSINYSHLDEYYSILAIAVLISLCFYWGISNKYITNEQEDLEPMLEIAPL